MKMITPAITCLLLAAAWATAVASDENPLLPSRVEHAITTRIAAGEYPAMVVTVVDGNRSHVYGFGKLADGKTPDADTIFQIGSVTKTFTATLLAEAIDRGAVQANTPVAALLPEFKLPSRNGKAITLGELAMQDSGLPRVPDNLDLANTQDPYANYDVAMLKSFLATYALTRDPGASYEYSNLGMGVLGQALATHAGTSYADLVEERMLAPLGMTSSSALTGNPNPAHWATGHTPSGRPAPRWHFGVLAGAGGINSTGGDMLRYLEANLGRGPGRLVAAMRRAHMPRRRIANDERIGLVWMTRRDRQEDVIWHNGEMGGYASFMGFTADGKRGVVILTNVARSVDALGFATLLPDAPLSPGPKWIHLTSAQLDAYVGTYRLTPDFTIRVSRSGNRLLAQATGQQTLPVFPYGKDQFTYIDVDARISFGRDVSGHVNMLTLHQNGIDQVARRVR